MVIASHAFLLDLINSMNDAFILRTTSLLINSEVQLLYWCWLMSGASAAHVCLPWWKAVFAWMVPYFMQCYCMVGSE
jgi:hypothetical protein